MLALLQYVRSKWKKLEFTIQLEPKDALREYTKKHKHKLNMGLEVSHALLEYKKENITKSNTILEVKNNLAFNEKPQKTQIEYGNRTRATSAWIQGERQIEIE